MGGTIIYRVQKVLPKSEFASGKEATHGDANYFNCCRHEQPRGGEDRGVCAAPCSDRFTVHGKWCSSVVRYAQNFACAGREAAGGGAPESSRPVSRTRKGLLKNL